MHTRKIKLENIISNEAYGKIRSAQRREIIEFKNRYL